MKKTFLFLCVITICVLWVPSVSAALKFKMTADNTNLVLGGDPAESWTTVHLWAHADDALAIGQNGLNQWQLSIFADLGGIVQVDPVSVTYLEPDPNPTDSKYLSINSPSGSIEDLQTIHVSTPADSETGVGGYTEIANFVIQATGIGSVTYTIGDSGNGFNGLLRDFNPVNPLTWGNMLEGSFDPAASDRIITVSQAVPEPSSLLILAGMAWIASNRRKHFVV